MALTKRTPTRGRTIAEGVALVALIMAGGWAGVATVRKLGLTEKARIDALEPDTRRRYLELRKRMAAKYGIQLRTGQTRRTQDQQNALVAKGLSATKQGWHLVGRAIDVYPIDKKTGQPDTKGLNVDAFRKMHLEADALGFRGIAFSPDGSKRYITTSKGKVWDAGHIEYRGEFRTVAEAAKAKPKTIVT